jgi:predicted aminopeptidase
MWNNLFMQYHLIPLFLLIGILIQGCSISYVIKQGFYQLKLLADAEHIEIALRNKNLDINKRKKLELILDVRKFAAQNLKLTIQRNYKNVNLSWHHILYTVSASQPLQFKPHLWWFPIIGSVPYKGFFEQGDAQKEQAKLIDLGLDTQKGIISGYSTLGYFPDPVWSAMLSLPDEALIELIIHELVHATIYFRNQTPFNETLANFIGKIGALDYVINRFGEGSLRTNKLIHYQQQGAAHRDFFSALYGDLDVLYNSNIDDNEKMNKKVEIFKQAKINYLNLAIDEWYKDLDWSRINNAFLMSFKTYNYDDKIFRELLSKVNRNFEKFFDEIRLCGESGDAFTTLKSRLANGNY